MDGSKVVESWKEALDQHDELAKYGDNSIGLFALALRFEIEDLESAGASAIVDGGNDKKIDLIYIDEEIRTAVVIQAYRTKTKKTVAPANKASDLNTAVSWLFSAPLDKVPVGLQNSATRLRDGITNGSITKLFVWYVHNCTESKNVREELDMVKNTLHAVLKQNYPKAKIKQAVSEIGNSTLSEWYAETQSPIAVADEISFKCGDGFRATSVAWSSFITTVSAVDIYNLYKTHNVKLFSANVRDYLGARDSDSNINNGIVQTLTGSPENFLVFNNGLTALTHKVDFNRDEGIVKVRGISIVNGAQTTGAIGSLTNEPHKDARVPVRFISVTTGNTELIQDIVRYNNSQNHVTAADFRSTDAIQKRLRVEVASVNETEYEGGRRGGFGSAIKRKPNLMASFTVGQALAAFHGEPSIAYNKKSEIWKNDAIYSEFFNEKTTGVHLIFVYSLLKAIEANKSQLLEKVRDAQPLTKLEESRLEFYRLPAALLYMSTL